MKVRKLAIGGGALSLCLAGFQAGFLAGPVGAAPETGARMTICHATSSVTNPYRAITVSISALGGGGKADHSTHAGDIIPPVNGHEGVSWDAKGTAVYAAGSVAVGPADSDRDGTIDLNDLDDDEDGISDSSDPDSPACRAPRTSPAIADPNDAADADQDGQPDATDLDDDADGLPDFMDADDDADGIPDEAEPAGRSLALAPTRCLGAQRNPVVDNGTDTDGDGTPNASDPDDDADGTPDIRDRDADGDGTPEARSAQLAPGVSLVGEVRDGEANRLFTGLARTSDGRPLDVRVRCFAMARRTLVLGGGPDIDLTTKACKVRGSASKASLRIDSGGRSLRVSVTVTAPATADARAYRDEVTFQST